MKKEHWACDFCEKTQYQVAQIVAGPRNLAICDECIGLCVDIISGKASQIVDGPTHHPAPQTSATIACPKCGLDWMEERCRHGVECAMIGSAQVDAKGEIA